VRKRLTEPGSLEGAQVPSSAFKFKTLQDDCLHSLATHQAGHSLPLP
jgi:hypothetical protein